MCKGVKAHARCVTGERSPGERWIGDVVKHVTYSARRESFARRESLSLCACVLYRKQNLAHNLPYGGNGKRKQNVKWLKLEMTHTAFFYNCYWRILHYHYRTCLQQLYRQGSGIAIKTCLVYPQIPFSTSSIENEICFLAHPPCANCQ